VNYPFTPLCQGPKQSSALLATEKGQSFRRKFKGDFEETEGFCDSQGNGERLSTNNSLPGMAHVVVETDFHSSLILLFTLHGSSFIFVFLYLYLYFHFYAAESVGLSTSSMSSNPAGLINATHQADVHSIPSTVCTSSRTNAPGPSMQSTTNPNGEKTTNAGRKLAESRRTRDSSTKNSLPGMAHVLFSRLPFTINFIIHSSF
jgi:hypothetical protein